MKKTSNKEFNKIFNSHSIKRFLKDTAQNEVNNDETYVKVKKGDEKSFATNAEKAPYTIEMERPIGASLAKDKSFAGYLGDIFGSKAVDFKAEKMTKATEKVTFVIKGEDDVLFKKINKHTAKLSK